MEGEDLVIHGMSGVDPHSHFEVLDSNCNNIYTKTIYGVMKSQYCVAYLTRIRVALMKLLLL